MGSTTCGTGEEYHSHIQVSANKISRADLSVVLDTTSTTHKLRPMRPFHVTTPVIIVTDSIEKHSGPYTTAACSRTQCKKFAILFGTVYLNASPTIGHLDAALGGDCETTGHVLHF
jgi:hypothetical protein